MVMKKVHEKMDFDTPMIICVFRCTFRRTISTVLVGLKTGSIVSQWTEAPTASIDVEFLQFGTNKSTLDYLLGVLVCNITIRLLCTVEKFKMSLF